MYACTQVHNHTSALFEMIMRTGTSNTDSSWSLNKSKQENSFRLLAQFWNSNLTQPCICRETCFFPFYSPLPVSKILVRGGHGEDDTGETFCIQKTTQSVNRTKKSICYSANIHALAFLCEQTAGPATVSLLPAALFHFFTVSPKYVLWW